MAVIGAPVQNCFLKNSALPVVGTLANASAPNCLKQAINNCSTQLAAGDPIVTLVSTASYPSGEIDGFNPMQQSIIAKATTVTGGEGSTNITGFMIVNSNDKVSTGGVGIPSQGQLCNYAPLGQGALIWLEVASQNLSGFAKNLGAGTGLTIDTTNGGVKVEESTPIPQMKIVGGVVDAQKISVSGNSASLVPCKAILVQLV